MPKTLRLQPSLPRPHITCLSEHLKLGNSLPCQGNHELGDVAFITEVELMEAERYGNIVGNPAVRAVACRLPTLTRWHLYSARSARVGLISQVTFFSRSFSS